MPKAHFVSWQMSSSSVRPMAKQQMDGAGSEVILNSLSGNVNICVPFDTGFSLITRTVYTTETPRTGKPEG
jgi:hypothetical protein